MAFLYGRKLVPASRGDRAYVCRLQYTRRKDTACTLKCCFWAFPTRLETLLHPYLPSKADVETESGQHKDLQWGFPDVGPEER